MMFPRQTNFYIRTTKHDHIKHIIHVPEAVSHIDRQLDLAIGSLKYCICQMVFHSCKYGVIMTPDFPLKFYEYFYPTMLCPFDSSVKFGFGGFYIFALKDEPQLFFKQISPIQTLI